MDHSPFLVLCHPDGPCGIGDGTCTSNYDCAGLLVCGYDEGACNTLSGNLGPDDSCCTDGYRCSSFSTYHGCCTDTTPCGRGDGDCDLDSHCRGYLKCGTDNCEQKTGSYPEGYDCCE